MNRNTPQKKIQQQPPPQQPARGKSIQGTAQHTAKATVSRSRGPSSTRNADNGNIGASSSSSSSRSSSSFHGRSLLQFSDDMRTAQELGAVVDSLIVRDATLAQQDKNIDAMEKLMEQIEADTVVLEKRNALHKSSCPIVDEKSGARAARDDGLDALWSEYGDEMVQSFENLRYRLAKLIERQDNKASTADGDDDEDLERKSNGEEEGAKGSTSSKKKTKGGTQQDEEEHKARDDVGQAVASQQKQQPTTATAEQRGNWRNVSAAHAAAASSSATRFGGDFPLPASSASPSSATNSNAAAATPPSALAWRREPVAYGQMTNYSGTSPYVQLRGSASVSTDVTPRTSAPDSGRREGAVN